MLQKVSMTIAATHEKETDKTEPDKKSEVEPTICYPDEVPKGWMEEPGKYAPCGCLWRTPPPEAPTTIPFKDLTSNVNEIKLWIKGLYASSAFN